MARAWITLPLRWFQRLTDWLAAKDAPGIRPMGEDSFAIAAALQTKDDLTYRSRGSAALTESLVQRLRFVVEPRMALWWMAEAAVPSGRFAESPVVPVKKRRAAQQLLVASQSEIVQLRRSKDWRPMAECLCSSQLAAYQREECFDLPMSGSLNRRRLSPLKRLHRSRLG